MFICKFLIRILLGILIIFVVRGNTFPISSSNHEQFSEPAAYSDSVPSDVGSLFFPEHRSREYAKPEVVVGVVQATQSSEDGDVNESSDPSRSSRADSRTFITTHHALVIGLCILAPFVLCVVIYPIFKYYRGKKKTSQAPAEAASDDETADRSFEDKCPDASTSEKNVIQGEPQPDYPTLIYVPPSAENGAQTIFGHFMSPCGRVVGVKDTWRLAGSQTVANNA